MWLFMKAFGIFWIIFLIWYLTGGPLRDDKTKKYVGPSDTGLLITSSTTDPYIKKTAP
jgi:hypothetical protein